MARLALGNSQNSRKHDCALHKSKGELRMNPLKLMETETFAEAAAIVEDTLVARLAKSLGLAQDDIVVSQPMHTYCVDSLVAVEVRNWLIRELQADISVIDILGTMPISALAIKIVETSRLLVNKFTGAKVEVDGVGETDNNADSKEEKDEKEEKRKVQAVEKSVKLEVVDFADKVNDLSEHFWRLDRVGDCRRCLSRITF